MTSRFDDLPCDPRSHFEVCLHGAVLLVVDQIRATGRKSDLGRVLARHPFLGGYLDAAMPFVPPDLAWDGLHAWWASTVAAWEEPVLAELPLARLGARRAGPAVAGTQLLLAGLVDEDSRFGAVFAELGGARRPTLELVAALTRPLADSTGSPDSAGVAAGLVDDGVLLAGNTDGPRSEWLLRVSSELWEVVRGDADAPRGVRHTAVADLADLDALVSTEDFVERCAAVAEELAGLDLVLVRGSAGSDRLAVAESLCRRAGRPQVLLTGPDAAAALTGIGPVVTALHAVPVVELDPAPGESVRLTHRGYSGPVVAVLGTTGGVDGSDHERQVTLELPRLDAPGRARRWRQSLAGAPCDDVDGIAMACGLQGRHIEQVSRAALTVARMEGASALGLGHVREAAGQLHRRLLDDLATRLETAGGWDDVVVGDFTAARLAELETRCRHRERIGASLPSAYARGTGVGVRALFTGASGTGKTLAATVLGHRLGLDVHRLDLSAVVDKYIGETEKNLHRVLSAAEELDVVLLIDEGDSLLGRRTEVRSANDRFANQETNFLLQRLEHYRGIVVITTNAPDHVDVAFQRRMDVTVGFLPPSPRERVEIWRLHLPDEHVVSDELVQDLSQRCTMTGGQIRNAVLHAVLLAVQDDRSVGDRHVEQAVLSEYQKAGASSPYDPSGRRHTVSRARAFHEVVS